MLLVMLGHTLQHAFGGRRSPALGSIHLASLLGHRRRFSRLSFVEQSETLLCRSVEVLRRAHGLIAVELGQR